MMNTSDDLNGKEQISTKDSLMFSSRWALSKGLKYWDPLSEKLPPSNRQLLDQEGSSLGDTLGSRHRNCKECVFAIQFRYSVQLHKWIEMDSRIVALGEMWAIIECRILRAIASRELKWLKYLWQCGPEQAKSRKTSLSIPLDHVQVVVTVVK